MSGRLLCYEQDTIAAVSINRHIPCKLFLLFSLLSCRFLTKCVCGCLSNSPTCAPIFSSLLHDVFLSYFLYLDAYRCNRFAEKAHGDLGT
jgi:hypothetical protein